MSLTKYQQKRLLEQIKEGEVFVKLHKGDPGEEGLTNAAAETTRKKIEFGAITSEELMKNTNVMEWLAVSTSETYSHFSIWDNVSAGNCRGYGELTASVAVTAGQDFRIKAEKIEVKAI